MNDFLNWFSPPAMIAIVVWIVLDVRKIDRRYKAARRDYADASDDFSYALDMLGDVLNGKRTRESAGRSLKARLEASGGYDLEARP